MTVRAYRLLAVLLALAWLVAAAALSTPAPPSEVGAAVSRSLWVPRLWLVLLIGSGLVAGVARLGMKWWMVLILATAVVFAVCTLTCPPLHDVLR